MPAKVNLKITKGDLAGQEFAFSERNTCIVGRAKDCNLAVPNDNAHRRISRHHCLLDINPPDVRVRDFGSLNGTYVNGKIIGRRDREQTPEEALEVSFPEYDLKDGDTIRLAETVFRVEIYVPAVCVDCVQEIPQGHETNARIGAADGSPVYRCGRCREKAGKAKQAVAPKPKKRRCVKCGRDVSREVGRHRQGDYVCGSCQADPMALIKKLLRLADTGDEKLLAIRGYEILRELGRGGFGVVYLARHKKTNRQVALKVMIPKIAVDQRNKESFLREIQNTKILRHPNVVCLHDDGFSNGTFYFTLEFCEGGSLDELMKKRGGKLTVDEALPLVLQALDGLEFAHNVAVPHRTKTGAVRGLVHRDLKPQNLFLSDTSRSPVVKVADFGMSKAFDAAGFSGQTRTGTVAGTPVFMPRQQVINFKYAKPDVDVWAMAATLYHLLTGRFPRDFRPGKDPWQTVLQTDPVPIRQRDRAIPGSLAKIVDAALQDRKRLQFKTAAELKRALEQVI